MFEQVNRLLTSLETTAWRIRGVSDEALRLGEQARSWTVGGARLSSTGWTLAQVATDYRLYAIYSAFLGQQQGRDALERLHRRNAQRFYRASVRHQGAFLKIGQLLSARPDLLPAAWIEELSSLQDHVPAEPFLAIRAVIEADLGAPLAALFRSFDEVPLAAASIGQVHRAVTLDGVEVAVKVQRPRIAERCEQDLLLLPPFLDAMSGLLPPTDYQTIVAEVREMIGRELDYVAEATSMARLASHFAGTAGVRVPRPLSRLCSARVLTANFIAGDKITVALDRLDHRRRSTLLGTLLEVYLRQILEAGCFQADPHPGNFLVTSDGDLVLLDFGCTRTLSAETRLGYVQLVQAFVSGDDARLNALLFALGFRTASGRPDTLQAFATALLTHFRRGVTEGGFAWPSKQELFANAKELLEAAQRDPITELPSEFVMIGRVFGTLGGLFQHYQPDLDYAKRVLPHLFPVG